jgi:hypothetical protein
MSKQVPVSNKEALATALTYCKQLALDLDAGKTSSHKEVAEVLDALPVEAMMIAVRREVQLERLVKYNLDEDKFFGPLLLKGNNQMNTWAAGKTYPADKEHCLTILEQFEKDANA